jgi:predicted DNA-binding ribbon-helix-helix protein
MTRVTLFVTIGEMMVKRLGKKRFTIDIPEFIFDEVKNMADARNITLTGWMLSALIEKIAKERSRDR